MTFDKKGPHPVRPHVYSYSRYTAIDLNLFPDHCMGQCFVRVNSATSSGAILRGVFPSSPRTKQLPVFLNSFCYSDAYRMSDFTDDNEEVYEVENIVAHRKQRGKVHFTTNLAMDSLLMSPCVDCVGILDQVERL